MRDCKIKYIDENLKFEKVKLVEPNIKWNRCDIRYGKDFKLLEIKYEKQTKYISYYIEGSTCHLGLYMVEIPQYILNKVRSFILKKEKIKKFHIGQSINPFAGCRNIMHWLLILPASWEEYEQQFTSKTRYNRRYYKKKLEENFNCEWKYFSEKEIDENFIKDFYALKKQKKKIYYDANEKEFLSDYYKITDAYALFIDGEMKSVILYSIIDEHTAYCENLAYDLSLSKYNAGNVLYYYSLKQLLERNIRKIYLGGGDYDYKQNSKAIKSNTYSGTVEAYKRIKFKIFGIKISFKLKNR